VDILRDNQFGADILSRYYDRVITDYDDNPNLRIFVTGDGVVCGSNPFACVLIDSIVRPQFRLATPVDLQAIADSQGKVADPLSLRGFYKDVALALRSVNEPNGYQAERLSAQVGLKMELPVLIWLSGLELVRDTRSPCQLSFKVTKETHYYTAPILKEPSGHFSDNMVDRKTGFPTAIRGEGRYFYSTDEGLCRVYVGRGGSIDTIWDELSNSQPDGRIVLVDNRAPSHKLPQFLAHLDEAQKYLEEDEDIY